MEEQARALVRQVSRVAHDTQLFPFGRFGRDSIINLAHTRDQIKSRKLSVSFGEMFNVHMMWFFFVFIFLAFALQWFLFDFFARTSARALKKIIRTESRILNVTKRNEQEWNSDREKRNVYLKSTAVFRLTQFVGNCTRWSRLTRLSINLSRVLEPACVCNK